MFSISIRSIEDRLEEISNAIYRIYIIRGDGIVLYVGKSKDAVERVRSHLGAGEWKGFFGQSIDIEIRKNEKANFDVTFYSNEDIARIYSIKESEDDYLYYQKIDMYVDDLENKLIYELSPAFNSLGKKRHNDNMKEWCRLYPDEPIEPIVHSSVVDSFLRDKS